jgi:hypothetical protein
MPISDWSDWNQAINLPFTWLSQWIWGGDPRLDWMSKGKSTENHTAAFYPNVGAVLCIPSTNPMINKNSGIASTVSLRAASWCKLQPLQLAEFQIGCPMMWSHMILIWVVAPWILLDLSAGELPAGSRPAFGHLPSCSMFPETTAFHLQRAEHLLCDLVVFESAPLTLLYSSIFYWGLGELLRFGKLKSCQGDSWCPCGTSMWRSTQKTLRHVAGFFSEQLSSKMSWRPMQTLIILPIQITSTGWWYTYPSEKILVNGKDYPIYYGK